MRPWLPACGDHSIRDHLTWVVVLAVALMPRAAGAESDTDNPGITVRSISVASDSVFSAEEQRNGVLGNTGSFKATAIGARLDKLLGPRQLDAAGVANWLHFTTRRSVIERELLFTRGALLDQSLLDETERNLRAKGFIRDASVSTTPVDGHQVDVMVRTKDAWTTEPRLDFSLLGGGHTGGSIGLSEDNLLGMGKTLSVSHKTQLYRNTDAIQYDDPQVMGTHWHLRSGLNAASDGHGRSLLLEYPFYALEVPDSVGFSATDIVDRERSFADGKALFRHSQQSYGFTIAHALIASSELVRRIGFDMVRQIDDFTPAHSGSSASSLKQLPLADRKMSTLALTFLEWHPRFVKAYFLDKLGRPEDRDLGPSLTVNFGYSPAVLHATHSEAILDTLARTGMRLDEDTYAWFGVRLAGREGGGRVRDGFASIEAITYTHIHALMDQTLVGDGRVDWSEGLARDHELLAGGADGGLRGYPINHFHGSRRAIIHFEDRALFVQDLFHLISLGGVGFLDAGQVWGRGRDFSASGFVASVGIGLRLASTRSAQQCPLRIDFAIPLTHVRGASPFDISAGSGQAFAPFSNSFATQGNATSSGF